MNIAMLLSPKISTSYLDYDSTVRQGLEKLRVHGFTAVPVLDDEGFYMGTVSEGDFLRYIMSEGEYSPKKTESAKVRDIMRQDKNPPLGIDASIEMAMERLMDANFVPIVDARGCYVGIVTRKSLLAYMKDRLMSLTNA